MHGGEQRPAGVRVIAMFCLAMAAAGLISAVCTAAGWWPLAWGRFVAGDFITMGPIAFLLAAALYATAGLGLWRRKNWARHLTIMLAAAGLIFLVPEISSAVVGFRIGAMAEDGLRIIIYVVVISYLFRSTDGDLSIIQAGRQEHASATNGEREP